MNEKVLQTLEYNKIIDLLEQYASSDAGKKMCRNLRPQTDPGLITEAQEDTAAALSRIFQKGSLSFSGNEDPTLLLRRLEIGGSLSAGELLSLCDLLEASKRAKSYGQKERSDEAEDCLTSLFSLLEPLTPLSNEIKRCILSEEEIADDASGTLRSIRRSIQGIHEKIRAQMNTMLNNTNTRNLLQDAVITMRNGRFCLPVKAEAKGQVPGMIHDQSASGSTLFIEPLAVVKYNNDLRELFQKEQEEIAVILASLSAQAAEYIPQLETNHKTLTELDFIFAKGSLAKSYNGSMPLFNQKGILKIRKGRHPLLNPKTVVPIEFHMGDTFQQLVITGPNTGGKTVSLKTVGLFTLMGQAGLHIPAGDRSQLAIFDEDYADIGDEQSIEQNLSTFSSHMTNIISILKKADSRSLVLFDELCAGTDPVEGAALATSILQQLQHQGVSVLATTHYSELKVYALSTLGVENACCEFSLETLSPTYRLLIGVPGKSNAFAISAKLGLEDSIIEDAKGRMEQKDESFEDLLGELEHNRLTIEKEKLQIQQYKEQIAAERRNLTQKRERLDSQREKILREANEEARRILQEAKDVADETIRSFHKYGSAGGTSVREMEQERDRLRKKMNQNQEQLSPKNPAVPNHKVPKNLRIGDSVKVLSMNLKGTVHSLPNEKGDLYVQMGILRSLVNIKDLVLLEEKPVTGKSYGTTGMRGLKMSKSLSVSSELNVIGKTTDEALALVDKYLDDAYLAHMPSVRLVHGKGTGALRNAIHQHLRRLSYVDSFRSGEFGEGDAGVTIVTFK